MRGIFIHAVIRDPTTGDFSFAVNLARHRIDIRCHDSSIGATRLPAEALSHAPRAWGDLVCPKALGGGQQSAARRQCPPLQLLANEGPESAPTATPWRGASSQGPVAPAANIHTDPSYFCAQGQQQQQQQQPLMTGRDLQQMQQMQHFQQQQQFQSLLFQMQLAQQQLFQQQQASHQLGNHQQAASAADYNDSNIVGQAPFYWQPCASVPSLSRSPGPPPRGLTSAAVAASHTTAHRSFAPAKGLPTTSPALKPRRRPRRPKEAGSAKVLVGAFEPPPTGLAADGVVAPSLPTTAAPLLTTAPTPPMTGEAEAGVPHETASGHMELHAGAGETMGPQRHRRSSTLTPTHEDGDVDDVEDETEASRGNLRVSLGAIFDDIVVNKSFADGKF